MTVETDVSGEAVDRLLTAFARIHDQLAVARGVVEGLGDDRCVALFELAEQCVLASARGVRSRFGVPYK